MNVPLTELESDVWLWRNLTSSLEALESARKVPGQNTTSIAEANSMNTHRVGMYLILPCS